MDDIDRLTKIVHQRVVDAGEPEVLASWTIERDASGNPTRVVREDGEEWKYEHDPLDRLVKAQLPRELVERLRAQDQAKGPEKPDEDPAERLMKAGEIAYRYDAAGNRVEENYAGRLIASTYGPANEMLTRGNMSFSYDPRGNQTEKRFKSGNRQVFSYSSAGKLAALASGNENAKRAEDQLKILERYLYSPDGERVLVEDVQGKKLQHALWDGSRQIEEWHEVAHGAGKKEKGLLYTRDLGGQLLEQAGFERMNGRTANALQEGDADDGDKFAHVRWVAPDFLGSTALVTNRGGRVLDGQTFGPWGENIEGNRNKIRFGYTGHAWESQTGHWSALYRELDPRVGRWSQRDPLGTIDGQNRYGYVRQSPVTLTDPTGLIATRGERPTWLQQAINELAADVGPPFDSKCKQFPKCKICPSCPYNYLLRYSGSSIILDFTRPGRGADYAEVEPGVPAVIRIDGSLVRTGKEKFKEVLLHELTHICTIANMNRGGRVKHWEDPFRWMVFVRGDQAEGVKTFWAGLGPCDPCPDPPFTVKDL
ncbi:MAG: RHS repeat-associated core domain-containing protein [Candidatus Hydrogenedentes bacterium]|nr:RHS repeat-associated core domain-containing protein [Candidatus Hydrogenedentota bacterium]